MSVRHFFAVAAIATLCGFGSSPAGAASVFANSDMAIYNKDGFPATIDQKVYADKTKSSLTITGNVGSQVGLPEVLFTVDTPLDAADGFAQIGKGSGLFNSLTFEIPGQTFSGLKFSTQGDQADSNLTISAFLQGVLVGTFFEDGLGNSDQKWLVLGLFGQVFDKIVLTSTTGFKSIKHIEVAAAVPLPPAVLLFGTALVGMGIIGHRRRRRDLAA